jgi:hypothetical protein
LKKRIYVVKVEGQTFAYLEDTLKKIRVETGTEVEGVKETILLADDETIAAFMPDGRWHWVEVVEDLTGRHDAKVDYLLSEMSEEDTAKSVALPSGQVRQAFIDRNRQRRWPAVVVTVVVKAWSFDPPLTEDGVEDLPLDVKNLLVSYCAKKFNAGDHPAFLKSAWSRLDN